MPGKVKGKDVFKKDYHRKIPCDCAKGIDDVKCSNPEEKPVVIFCGQGGNAQFLTPDDLPVNIGSVTVAAKDLRNPLVKFKFSSMVNLTGTVFDPEATLTFRLFRVCDEGRQIPLNNWVYEAFQINNISVPLRFNTSFDFIFCDRRNSFEVCDYFVEVSVDNLVNATISVDNVQIQAIAQ